MSSAGLRRFVAGSPVPASPVPESPVPESTVPESTVPATTGPATTGPVNQGAGRPAGAEVCEFCAETIPARHDHVAELDRPALMCACRACYLLFTQSGAGLARPSGPGRYKAVPDRYRSDPARPLAAADWEALEIPVGLAFFLRSSAAPGPAAFYPSPAGATECQLNLAAWDRIAEDHPLLAAAEPDVEAILISRGPANGGGPPGPDDRPAVEAFLVPIDACYELAGRMRLLWQGFDGGAEARQSIADFLARVRARCRDLSPEA
jgi:Family of unknown function (DUF5947)